MRLFIWGIVLALARTAHAQVATDEFGIERLRLAMDRAALLDVDWAGVPAHGSWSATAYVGVAHDPLVVYRGDTAVDALIERRIATGLIGSIALWERVQLGVGVDLIANQAGSESLMQLPSGGLGDARAIVKVLAYGTQRFQLAIVPTLTIPAGSAGGYLRESGVAFAPAIAISGRVRDRLRLAGNAGYRMRSRTETAGLVVDDEVFARAGVGVAVGKGELATSLSFAAPPTDRGGNQIAVEGMLGGTLHVTSAIDVFVAGGAGFANGFGTPDYRALAGVRIEPSVGSASKPPAPRIVVVKPVENLDPDGDGLQGSDRCPNSAEDKDGFQDDDGCPDPDGKVEGRVLDLEGLPIANAAIHVTYVDHPALPAVDVVSDGEGRFAAPIAGAGALEIAAEVAEYQRGTASAKVEPGATAQLEIKLARKVRQGQLRGQVLSFGGKPLAATVIVSAAGAEVARATADADGNFTVELPAGSFDVLIEAAGHITQKRTVKTKLDGVTVLNLDMRGTK